MTKKKILPSKSRYLVPAILVIGILGITLGLYGYNLIPHAVPIGINQISNATGETTLSLSPNTVNTTINTDVTLSLTANAGTLRLGVARIELTYDPAKISTPVVTLGSFLPNPLSSPTVENGKISFSVAATPDSGGVSGSGEIASIKFKPTVVGSSALTFTSRTAAYSLTIDKVSIDDDTLRSASDATINASAIVTDAVTSPTPTPTSTPASNVVSVVTTTPAPTKKPVAAKPTTTPTPTASTYSTTYVDPDTMITQNSQIIPVDNIPLTQDTTSSSPSFFQKIFIGWGIIIQWILSLFGIN